MHEKQKYDGQAALITASLEWLRPLIRQVEFGTISGIIVTDGVLAKGPKFKTKFTRKPRSNTSPGKRDAKAGDDACDSAIRDLVRDTRKLQGEWLVEIKVANGIPQLWDMEQSGRSAVSPTK